MSGGLSAQPLDSQPTSRTPIGVDVGVKQVAVAAPADADPVDAVAVDGGEVRTLYAEFTKATHGRTQEAGPTPESLGAVVAKYWPRFEAAFERAADVLVEYARQHPRPVLVFEDLGHERKPLVACKYGNVAPSEWVPGVAINLLPELVRDAGVPAVSVRPEGTSSECHRCGERGDLGRDVLTCTTASCPVDDVCRDRSAAVSIANRV
jgi:transposase